MGSEGIHKIFVFLCCFWTILLVLSNVFDVTLIKNDPVAQLSETHEKYNIQNFGDVIQFTSSIITNFLDNVVGIDYFSPLIRMLTFQYADFPIIIGIFLNLTVVLTIWTVVYMVKVS